VLPAQQRFPSGHRAAAQVQARLVEQPQPLAVDCPAEPGRLLRAVVGGVPQLAGEDVVAVSSAGLGRIHGGVGVPDQLIGSAVPLVGGGDADADRQRQLDIADREGVIERRPHPVGEGDAARGVAVRS
jgi:hypothetical protein